ncbi:MAG: YiiX/YebB-like N1pC/P60 family cysteine hydrolase [Porticoccaceae bacterium]
MILERIGGWLARKLAEPRYLSTVPSRPEQLAAAIRPGDVLLVEGVSRFSLAIKYLTQSTWSHAALYIGNWEGQSGMLVEADVQEGVRLVPLSHFEHMHTRICRPVKLDEEEVFRLINYATDRLGHRYDLKNIFDLMRYMVSTPPVPNRWRRRMLSLGSGDPTRAICSSLIAQAFQSIPYPILPKVVMEKAVDPDLQDIYQEILHIRHHSLYVPRDFDLSPYFEIIKPTLDAGFDPHQLTWSDRSADAIVGDRLDTATG